MIWWKGIPYSSIGGLQPKVALLASEVEVLRQTQVPAYLLLECPLLQEILTWDQV